MNYSDLNDITQSKNQTLNLSDIQSPDEDIPDLEKIYNHK